MIAFESHVIYTVGVLQKRRIPLNIIFNLTYYAKRMQILFSVL